MLNSNFVDICFSMNQRARIEYLLFVRFSFGKYNYDHRFTYVGFFAKAGEVCDNERMEG